MPNQNQSNQENEKFKDGSQTERSMNQNIQKGMMGGDRDPAAKSLTSDDSDTAGEVYVEQYMNRPEDQVRQNEDASLQDDSYAFDEDNTGDEEYHDADDSDLEDFDLDNDDDFVP